MAPITYKQDLPPEGGYEKIAYKRLPARAFWGPLGLTVGFASITSVAFYFYYRTFHKMKALSIETRDAEIALEPILTAEREREFLKYMRRIRDEEANLMKDVPNWQVGTYYGEPIYKTVPKEKWVDPHVHAYYAHCDPKHLLDRAWFWHWR